MEECSEWDYTGICIGTCLFCSIYKSMSNSQIKFVFFADDTKLYREITSDKFVELLQEDPRKLEEWSKILYCISMMINVYIC